MNVGDEPRLVASDLVKGLDLSEALPPPIALSRSVPRCATSLAGFHGVPLTFASNARGV